MANKERNCINQVLNNISLFFLKERNLSKYLSKRTCGICLIRSSLSSPGQFKKELTPYLIEINSFRVAQLEHNSDYDITVTVN